MLDHSIRDPSPLPYHLSFMVELARRGRLATCTGLPFIFCHYDYSCYNSYVLTMVVERDCRGIGWYSEILI
jgi:hypothetical protein